MKLFDAHCHLQDMRIFNMVPQAIRTSTEQGVAQFCVNGTSEKDWDRVKQMSESHPPIIPCFGLHPWYIKDRSPTWFSTLKQYLDSYPAACVGEIGIDKGNLAKDIDFTDQMEVFRQQLQLAKDIKKPVSVHCVRAFGDLLDVMKSLGPFPDGIVLHSFLGSAEMVPELSRLGAYFSFSGFLLPMKKEKAKKMLRSVPLDRILLETDSPDALPKSDLGSLFVFEGDPSISPELWDKVKDSNPSGSDEASDAAKGRREELPKGMLNHPANILVVLDYVASLLGKSKEEVAEISYLNGMRLFSYEGSKLSNEGSTSEMKPQSSVTLKT